MPRLLQYQEELQNHLALPKTGLDIRCPETVERPVPTVLFLTGLERKLVKHKDSVLHHPEGREASKQSPKDFGEIIHTNRLHMCVKVKWREHGFGARWTWSVSQL